MASLLFREMRESNFSCSSTASAAVCASIGQRSIISPSSGRSSDRHTSRLKDTLRESSLRHSSQHLTIPKSCNQKSRKSKENQLYQISSHNLSSRHRWSREKQSELISPENSSSYLWNNTDGGFFDDFPDPKPVLALPPLERNESDAILRPSSSNVVQDQVVVLRVSLHCKGCEGKVRRLLSKMEGVTSFSLDLVTKKVVVMGKVTTLGVLNSISKVKNAEFWSSPRRSSVSFY